MKLYTVSAHYLHQSRQRTIEVRVLFYLEARNQDDADRLAREQMTDVFDNVVLDVYSTQTGADHDPDCTCGACQENDRLGYDADVLDPRQYCRHGTFIGSPGGPDYLCAACEMGE